MIKQKTYSLDDYFKFTERMPDAKFEFVEGQIIPLYETQPLEDSFVDFVLSPDFDPSLSSKEFDMPTQIHDLIVSNLHILFGLLLKKTSFRIYSQASQVFIEGKAGSRIPDLVVVQKNEESRNKKHQILNPFLMIEVLSKSTQRVDKTDKLEEYQSLASLEEYLMISQTEAHLIIYRKLQQNKWEQEIIKGLDQSIALKSLGSKIALQDIYEEVDFKSA
ncbi:MAG: Uma2 family endonuclease [Bacteroidota bacterium]